MSLLEFLSVQLVLSIAVILFCWFEYERSKKAQIVDAGWAFCFFLAGLLAFFGGKGNFTIRAILLVMVSAWSLRLFVHLLRRYIISNKEDPRYRVMRENMGGSRLAFLGMFLLQAALATFLSLPFFLAANQFEKIGILQYLGMGVFLIGLICESVADHQLAEFKKKNSPLAICEDGLWRLSRHPNYFFEWVIWIGFALFALSAPKGLLAIISPALILYLLLRVSGIPLLEKESLSKKGDAYREYQKRTNAFLPKL